MGMFSDLLAQSRRRVERDRKRGVERIGGRWNRPIYSLSYLSATRALYDALASSPPQVRDRLVLPCMFAARHSIELTLKQLVEALADIEEDLRRYQHAMQERVTAVGVPKADLTRLARTHDLDELLRILDRNLKLTGRGPLPEHWKDTVARISKLEDGAPDRFRYDEVRWRRGTGRKVRGHKDRFKKSFPRERPIPVRSLVAATERLVTEAVDPNEDLPSVSMYLDWMHEAHSYVETLYVNDLL